MREPRPWRKRFGRVALVIAGTLAALLFAEVVLRVLGVERVTFYDYDEELGWAPRPGARGRPTEEGDAWVEINAAGFRDVEHELAHPEGTLRIAVLGDSYADAIQVPLEVTWWHRLEAELASCPSLGGRRVEVLDFGVRGYGTAQELLTYRRAVRDYHPDRTVLLYTPENDLVENTPALSAKGYLAPFFVYEGDELVLRPRAEGATFLGVPSSLVARAMFGLRAHSRVFGLLDLEALWTRIRDDERERNRFHADGDARLESLVTYSEAYVEPTTPVLLDAWRVTDGLLGMLASEVEADGGELTIVVGTSPIVTYPDRSVREAFAARIGVTDLRESDRRIEALGAELGVDTIALAPAFVERADRTGDYLHGFAATGMGLGHWNDEGHALAAREIAASLCVSLTAAAEP